MKFRMYKCKVCHRYTLNEKHCGAESTSAHPVRFSPHDKYAKYKVRAGEINEK